MDICKGSLVYSRAGRDNGGLFVVLKTEGDYAYIADGVIRNVLKPKKKKLKHLNKTNTVAELDFDNLSDSAVRKFLQSNPINGR